jgi:hypothetical protein
MRVGKYPWYSYYSPKGVATDVLWRYCDECKKVMISYYGIDESYFGKPEDQADLEATEKEYWSISHDVRTKKSQMEMR